jgi:urea carboxylase
VTAVGTVSVPDGAVPVTAPFTATVWQVAAAPGATVAEGDPILSLEAMKMESKVTAPAAGTLLEVYVKPGEQVAPGQVLAAVRA